MTNISTLAIPVITTTTTSSSQLVDRWVRTYHYGHQVLPALCVLTCSLYGYAAYTTYTAGGLWRVFATAGATTAGMLPFTWIVMIRTNNALFRAHRMQNCKAEGGKGGDVMGLEEAQGLVARWKRLHFIRSMFPLVGAVLGMLEMCRVLVF